MHTRFLIDKLHKAVPVLFRCTKIRKYKFTFFKCSWSDVYVLNSRQLWHDDVHGALRLLMPSMAAKHYALAGKLRFTNFLLQSQKQLRFCVICQLLCCECTIRPQHHYYDPSVKRCFLIYQLLS